MTESYEKIKAECNRLRNKVDILKKDSLRDQFAIAALQGFLSGRYTGRTEGTKVIILTNDELSEKAYQLADAMMEARKK